MRRVGPFEEYTIDSQNDRIECTMMYLRRLFNRDHISYRECVEFIGQHGGDIQFVINSANYSLCLNDFITYIAPPLVVYLDNLGVNTGLVSVDVYNVGRAWSIIKLREKKSEDISKLYAVIPNPTANDIKGVLTDGDPLKQISADLRMKPEKLVYMMFSKVDKSMSKLRELLDDISCYLNQDEGNYVVKILPCTSHIDMMTFADRIYSCF